MESLPLSHLIDALAQLDEEVAQRATANRAAEHEQMRRAREEGGSAGEDVRVGDWPDERADWYQAVGPLRALCLQRLRRELEHDESVAIQAEKLLAVLVAAARRRDGASINVDTALGR